MSRRIVILAAAGAVVAVVGALSLSALTRPEGGDGWRLDPAATWHEPLDACCEPAVRTYGSDAEEVGVGVTVYGDPTCPPELREVVLGEDAIHLEFGERRGWLAWTCSLGAGPSQFGVVVERDHLPQPPFSVVIDEGDRPPTTIEIDSVP